MAIKSPELSGKEWELGRTTPKPWVGKIPWNSSPRHSSPFPLEVMNCESQVLGVGLTTGTSVTHCFLFCHTVFSQ